MTRDAAGARSLWIDTPLARYILRRKHALPILITAYERGPMSTSDMIRSVHGHPAAVLDTIRDLERVGLLHRSPGYRGRHLLEVRLTSMGLQLMDTSLSHWERLVRKWESLSKQSAAAFR